MFISLFIYVEQDRQAKLSIHKLPHTVDKRAYLKYNLSTKVVNWNGKSRMEKNEGDR